MEDKALAQQIVYEIYNLKKLWVIKTLVLVALQLVNIAQHLKRPVTGWVTKIVLNIKTFLALLNMLSAE